MKPRPQKLILECALSPGDITVLTATVRDLHRLYPGRYVTDVRTSCPDLWLHNPWIQPLSTQDPEVLRISCHYPLIHRANLEPWHFLHGFMQDLGTKLGLELSPTEFRGDLHLSPEERSHNPLLPSPAASGRRRWIIAAGGKYDFTIKWWHRRRWQAVVDALIDEIEFIQVGETGHYHPLLNHVVDLRGKTSLRDLVVLIHHADGVLCPVTSLMHLAAAVPRPADRPAPLPCVVVAGGRETAHWEAYPTHRFLHTIGLLPCCATGGCWKVRSVALGDGHANDDASNRCVDFDAAAGLPRCMASITPETVIAAIRSYLSTPGSVPPPPSDSHAHERRLLPNARHEIAKLVAASVPAA
ncbi:MAG: ADP-heptose--LPS heptosyltransferase [Verrucomicrobiales bacterium]|nr:ADP-heptose--LPS heptosyltransferase [Verrucomicrobiales bacterium]